jgi:glycosyltransferase involved in cell wall biosynthesis
LNDFPQARLDLVGDDRSEGQYVWLAETLSLGDVAHFSDSVAARDVADVIAQCDVVVLPSRHDGWGMALNEGASAGKALIGTEACGSAHHLIIPGRNGFRVTPGSERALARAMLEYCKQPELCGTHGAESLKVFTDFTPEKNAERLVNVLESLTPLPSPHRARVSIP